jgi:murein DD-endopeptidase MepM/ murein hydrolase activator NlpD
MQGIGTGPLGQIAQDALAASADQMQARVRAAQGGAGEKGNAELKHVSQEFESLFISYLLKVMRETIDESGSTDEGFGKSIYTELFDQEMSRTVARRGALGLADMLVGRLSAAESAEPPQISSPATPDGESEIPDFKLPVSAPVGSGFGPRVDPISHRTRFHKGVDLPVPEGVRVHPAYKGQVVFAGYAADYGKTVVIRHSGGFQTRYAHLGAIAVKAGDVVSSDQSIGVVGRTGRATGPHLHFEVERQGERINPKSMVTL